MVALARIVTIRKPMTVTTAALFAAIAIARFLCALEPYLKGLSCRYKNGS